MTHQQIAAINAVLFFFIWLVIIYAGADHPPPPGFVWVVVLDFVAALLVLWRVPFYLRWRAERRRHALLNVAGDGLIAGLAFAGLTAAGVALVGDAPNGAAAATSYLIWFAVLGVVGVANAVTLVLVNWIGVHLFTRRQCR